MDKPQVELPTYEKRDNSRCNRGKCTSKGIHRHNGQYYCDTCLSIVTQRATW